MSRNVFSPENVKVEHTVGCKVSCSQLASQSAPLCPGSILGSLASADKALALPFIELRLKVTLATTFVTAEQPTDEWYAFRFSRVTAGRFNGVSKVTHL